MEVYGFVLVSVFVNVCILVTVSVSGLHYTRDDLDSLNAWIPADLVLYNILWVFLSIAYAPHSSVVCRFESFLLYLDL